MLVVVGEFWTILDFERGTPFRNSLFLLAITGILS